ncbi:Crp/Fnr family transcriptional regulator [Synechocystis sp. LKSZ1]|uniref:Crp/Fnr family transcriptional regulator n=1 Tax=Synechocystis sp. LKSZ1 TaxID=3144951 RepID=UPI00336C272B
MPQSIASSLKNFTTRTLLPHKNNCFWKIESGIVRTFTWLEDGTLVTLGLWGPGDIVGKNFASITPYKLECLTPVQASLILQNHDELIEMLVAHIQQMNELAVVRRQKTVDKMLFQFLKYLANKFGKMTTKGQLIDIRLTHQDLADLLGTSRVTITRCLGQLEDQKLINRQVLRGIVIPEDEIWHYEI